MILELVISLINKLEEKGQKVFSHPLQVELMIFYGSNSNQAIDCLIGDLWTRVGSPTGEDITTL